MSTATEIKTENPINDEYTFAAKLEEQTIAVRMNKTHLGITKQLNEEQSNVQANAFHAMPEMLSGSKRLFRKGNQKIKAIRSVINSADAYVKSITVEFPEPKIRLLNHDVLDDFNARMNQYLDDLADAMASAEQVYRDEIIPEARSVLGDLYNSVDYPETLLGQWSIDWDFPSVQPDDRLKQLNPALYEHERQRVQQRFEEAIELQEQVFITRLQEIVSGLVDRLSPQEVRVYRYAGPIGSIIDTRLELIGLKLDDLEAALDHDVDLGNSSSEQDKVDHTNRQQVADLSSEQRVLQEQKKLTVASLIEVRGNRISTETEKGKEIDRDGWTVEDSHAWLTEHACELTRTKSELKTFHATTVTHLTDFFESFKSLNIGSNAELDALVEEAQNTIQGVNAEKLRKTEQDGRDTLRTPLTGIGERLEELMVIKPKRAISLKDE